MQYTDFECTYTGLYVMEILICIPPPLFRTLHINAFLHAFCSSLFIVFQVGYLLPVIQNFIFEYSTFL
jgi:hypothetical protein